MANSEPAGRRNGINRSVVLPALASLAVIVGSLMSWTVTTGSGHSLSISGVDAGHGKITIAGGLVAAALLASLGYRPRLARVATILGFLAGLGSFGFALYDTVRTATESSSTVPGVAVHVGVGLWLTLAAATILVVLMAAATYRAVLGLPAFNQLLNTVEAVPSTPPPSKSTLEVAARAVRQLPAQRQSADDAELAEQS